MQGLEEAALLSFLVERIGVGIFTLDTEFRIIQWNKFMAVHTGRPYVEVLNRNLFECFPDLPAAWLTQKLRGVFILKNFAFASWRQKPYLFPFQHNRLITGGVDYMRQDITFIPVRESDGEVRAASVVLFDVTDASLAQRAAEEATEKLRAALIEVEKLSTRDALTGLLNRRALDDRLELEMKRFARFKAPLSFALVDIDHFKRVNDTHGHLGGDAVLRGVASLVSQRLRETDVVSRYGGEELALILPGVPVEGGVRAAERVRQAVAEAAMDFAGTPVAVTVSIGVTEAREGMRTTDLIAEADAALYQCKREGRNRVLAFERCSDSVSSTAVRGGCGSD